MADKTTIEWADATLNVFRGTVGRWACTRVSPGCDHCYAATLNRRFGGPDYAEAGQPLNDTLRFDAKALQKPLSWRAPRRVFVHSMTDTFHEDVPDQWLDRLFDAMAAAKQHQFQVLTKRPKRMQTFVEEFYSRMYPDAIYGPADLLQNVWLGTSIELDRYAWRAKYLRETPAAVRFISAEPLLGPLPSLDLTGIDWVITGGESGPGHRPMDADWVRDLRDRCTTAGVAFFHKQGSGSHPGRDRVLDGQTWDQYPAPLVVAP